MASTDYYQVLGVSRNATTSDIRRRYQTLAKLHHPDHGGNTGTMTLINEAYGILSDPKRRFAYTESLAEEPIPRHTRTASPPTPQPQPPRHTKSSPKTYRVQTPIRHNYGRAKGMFATGVIVFIAMLSGSLLKSISYDNSSSTTQTATAATPQTALPTGPANTPDNSSVPPTNATTPYVTNQNNISQSSSATNTNLSSLPDTTCAPTTVTDAASKTCSNGGARCVITHVGGHKRTWCPQP